MKKLLTVLAVMFAFTLTSFSQNTVNTANWFLFVDNVLSSDTLFDVTFNPNDPGAPSGDGFVIVVFNDNLYDNVTVSASMVYYGIDITPSYADPINMKGIGWFKMNYTAQNPGTAAIYVTTTSYVTPEFTVADTLLAYNSGYDAGYNVGFPAGVASVDTQSYFDSGVASVDTQSYFDSGVASVDTSIYFYNGQLSINLDSIFEVGFLYGKSTDVVNIIEDASFNVYPNPVTIGDVVTVTTSSFTINVDVYNAIGQKIHSEPNNNTFSTAGFEKGLYLLVVTDDDGNVITDADRKTAKIIVR